MNTLIDCRMVIDVKMPDRVLTSEFRHLFTKNFDTYRTSHPKVLAATNAHAMRDWADAKGNQLRIWMPDTISPLELALDGRNATLDPSVGLLTRVYGTYSFRVRPRGMRFLSRLWEVVRFYKGSLKLRAVVDGEELIPYVDIGD